jgi:hypothetical protein
MRETRKGLGVVSECRCNNPSNDVAVKPNQVRAAQREKLGKHRKRCETKVIGSGPLVYFSSTISDGKGNFMDMWASEVKVAIAPEATYTTLVAENAGAMTCWSTLRRPTMVLLVIATLVPIMAVQRVTIGLMLTAALSWGFVVVIQVLVGAVIVASAPAKRVGFRRALDLWFAGHLPYSLWMLVIFAAIANRQSSATGVVLASAAIPAAWTAVIAAAFCRVVLGAQPSDARRRVALHAVGILAIASMYVVWAAGGMAGPLRFLRDVTGRLLR